MSTALARRALGGYSDHLAALGRADTTIRARTYWVQRLLADTGTSPWAIDTQTIEAWMARQTWQRATVRAVSIGLRQFFTWAQATGQRDDNPVQSLTVPKQPRYRHRSIPTEVLAEAMDRPHDSVWWILRVASTTGLRRMELATLHKDQLAGDWLTIRGKGDVTRRVPVPPDVAAWLRTRKGYAFPGRFGGHLHPVYLNTVVVRATGGYSCHALRHHYASAIYAATHDVLAVKELLGHASLATTQRYLGIEDDRLKTAARTVWAA